MQNSQRQINDFGGVAMVDKHKVTRAEMADPPENDQLQMLPPGITSFLYDEQETNYLTERIATTTVSESASNAEALEKPIHLAKNDAEEVSALPWNTTTTARIATTSENLVSLAAASTSVATTSVSMLHQSEPTASTGSALSTEPAPIPLPSRLDLDKLHGVVYPFRDSHFVSSLGTDDGSFLRDLTPTESEEEKDSNSEVEKRQIAATQLTSSSTSSISSTTSSATNPPRKSSKSKCVIQ